MKTNNVKVSYDDKDTSMSDEPKINNPSKQNKSMHQQTVSNQKSDDANKDHLSCEERNNTNLHNKIKKVKDTYANIVKKQLWKQTQQKQQMRVERSCVKIDKLTLIQKVQSLNVIKSQKVFFDDSVTVP